MTKNGIRGFAAGILIATAVFAFFYYLIFNEGTQSSAQKVVKQTPLTEATVTQYLTSHHRKAIDVDAYNQWQAANTKAIAKTDQTAKKPKSNPKPKTNSGKAKTVTYNLNIKAGMLPGDISNSLVQAKILNSNQKNAFDQYMHSKKLEKYVQLGTFKVSSDMSIQKIAQVITKNH